MSLSLLLVTVHAPSIGDVQSARGLMFLLIRLAFFAAFNWCGFIHKGISRPSMSLSTLDQH
jgi:hypothetical protein